MKAEANVTQAMPSQEMKTFEAACGEDWLQWLQQHHASESEVWLIFHKVHTGRGSIPYDDALDAALCYGWVDSLIKRLDDERYARKLTPRKADSKWSDVNRKRYVKLEAAGRVTPSGLQRAPMNRNHDSPRPSRSTPAALPQYIQQALDRCPAARNTLKTCRRPIDASMSAGSTRLNVTKQR